MVRYRHFKGQEVVARGVETHRGIALLKSISAYEAFRKRYPQRHRLAEHRRVLAPQPLFSAQRAFSASTLHDILKEIESRNPGVSGEPSRQAGWFSAQLNYLPSAAKVTEDEDPSIESLLKSLADLSESVSSAYFDPAKAQQSQGQSQSQNQGSQSQSQSQSGGGSQSQSQSQGTKEQKTSV